MKIAYLILAHQYPNLLCRLLNRIYTKNVSFVIHFDQNSKKEELISALESSTIPQEKIFWSKRESCAWGDFSLIQATLNCLNTLKIEKVEYDYAILLSGQDYPVKTNKYISDFLEYSDGNLYMEFFNNISCTKKWQKKVFEYRLQYFHFRDVQKDIWYNLKNDKKLYINNNFIDSKEGETIKKLEEINKEIMGEVEKCTFPRKMPKYPYPRNNYDEENIIPWGGSQWWILTNKATDFILRFVNDCPEYLEFHKRTYIPDEIFFVTIIMNNPELASKAIDNKLKFIDWSNPISKPMIFDDTYCTIIEDVVQNNPFCLFARKFAPAANNKTNSQKVLDMIDELLYKMEMKEYYEHFFSIHSPHIFQFNKIDRSFKVKKLTPETIVFNPQRFDVFLKFLYVKYREKGDNYDWFRTLYIEHERYFNNFQEDNFLNLKSGDDFLKKFDNLIDLFESNHLNEELTTIPVSPSDCPLDGAHRLAVAFAKNINVTCVTLDKKTPLTCYEFNFSFFVKKGMPLVFTDFVAKEYANLCPNAYLMILFPSCIDKWEPIESLIRKQVGVFYSKEISLTSIGKLNLIINLYNKEEWLGNFKNGFEGAHYKMNECFIKDGGVKVYLLNSDTLETVKNLKQKIRDFCGLGNHSVHSTDYHCNTSELATLFFNQNSIDFINNVESTNFTNFTKQFQQYKTFLENNHLNKEDFCIDGSAILAACNLRDCYDLDFLYYFNEKALPSMPEKVDCHNDYFMNWKFDTFLKLGICEIINNPEYHFFYQGYKIMHPRLIRDIKEYRNEPKDVDDVKLLNTHIQAIMQNKEALLQKKKYDPEWYPKMDELLKISFTNNVLPKVYLNARFSLSTKVKDWLIKWAIKFPDRKTIFNESDYFFTFEFFQTLNFEIEERLIEMIQPLFESKSDEEKIDIYNFCRICCVDFIQTNIPEYKNLQELINNIYTFLNLIES